MGKNISHTATVKSTLKWCLLVMLFTLYFYATAEICLLIFTKLWIRWSGMHGGLYMYWTGGMEFQIASWMVVMIIFHLAMTKSE